MPIRTLDEQALNDILLGATLLGSGGGGPVAIGQQLVRDLLSQPNPVQLADPGDFPDDAMMAVAAVAGSPDAALNQFSPTTVPIAFNNLESATGVTFASVLPIELGAGNSLIPMIVAVAKNIPVVDGSGAPRAMPKLSQCTFASSGLPVSPIAIADETTGILLEVADPGLAGDNLDRIVAGGVFPGFAGIACWPISAADMRKSILPGCTTYAEGLGRLIRETRQEGGDVVQAVLSYTCGRLLFQGTFGAINESTTGGLDVGRVTLTAASGEQAIVYSMNENLIMYRADQGLPIAMGPDSICYMTVDGEPFSNAEASGMSGRQVAVIGIPAPPEMRSAAIIDAFLVSLRALGYGGTYIPLD